MAGVGVLPLQNVLQYRCFLGEGGRGLSKVKVPCTIGLWYLGTTSPGSPGPASASFMPRKERKLCPGSPGVGCLGTALWAASCFPMPTSPSQLSSQALLPPPWEATEVLPARPSSQRQVCLQLSGAGPRGRAWPPHYSPSLRKRTSPVQ